MQTHCNSVANILQTFKTLLPVLPFHFIWRPRKHIEANISRPLSIHQIQWRYFGNQNYFRQKKSSFFTNFLFDANFSIRSHPAWPDLTDHHFIKLGLEKKTTNISVKCWKQHENNKWNTKVISKILFAALIMSEIGASMML